MYPKLGCQQLFDHPYPGLGQIASVVATPAQRQHAPVLEPIGQRAQVTGRLRMCGRRQTQVGQRIARDAVGAALQDQEFRLEARNVLKHRRPDLPKLLIA